MACARHGRAQAPHAGPRDARRDRRARRAARARCRPLRTLKVDGLRGELTLLRAARAVAALDGVAEATLGHLRQIAPLALRHRLRRDPLDDTGSSARIERAVRETIADTAAA